MLGLSGSGWVFWPSEQCLWGLNDLGTPEHLALADEVAARGAQVVHTQGFAQTAIQASVAGQAEMTQGLGVFDPPEQSPWASLGLQDQGTPEQTALANEVAARGEPCKMTFSTHAASMRANDWSSRFRLGV